LPLPPALLGAVAGLGYTELTPIQAASLPCILEGRDVIAQAQTGSGKTAAFGLGLLAALDAGQIRTQALVLCPTRELADQVAKELRQLARLLPNVKVLSLCGGIALRPQVASLKHPPHVLVGTPGRIEELLELGALDFAGLKVLVLDEADRMLDMGFVEVIAKLLAAAPKQRQTLLFSATFPAPIRELSRKFQRDPLTVTVEADPTAVEQHFYDVTAERKTDALAALLLAHKVESALVFCNTRRDCAAAAEELGKRGFAALALHGDLEQRDRDEVLVRFANRSVSVLVATDVAARGLDIKELPVVVSFDLASDPDQHLHRIGRTGRAGASGVALSLCTAEDAPRLLAIGARHGIEVRCKSLDLGDARRSRPAPPVFATLVVDAGRQDKLRPGDVVGALTGVVGLDKDAIGKIDSFATRTYVAVLRSLHDRALAGLRKSGIKGRSFRVRSLG
jgi:ATP-independent RNA helicase DbpA